MQVRPTQEQMMLAFQNSDPSAEGIFLIAVRTTGIFCKPGCPARKPKPENVEFFQTAAEALRNGYRPCKRCRPMDVVSRPPALVEQLRLAIDEDPNRRLADKDLEAMGIEPSTARRQFQRYLGMSFHAYQRSRQMGLALKKIRNGQKVIDAQHDLGFESASAFRDAFAREFADTPRNAKSSDSLFARQFDTPLGLMLAVAQDQGLCLLEFLDRRSLGRCLPTLREHFKRPLVLGDHPVLDTLDEQLDSYFSGRELEFNLPLLPFGSSWELRVWEQLRAIPTGSTQSYSDIAAALGRPGSQRAVGLANGRNRMAIVIPCHRVIRADGSLCGYGGGLWRKQWLLDHERRCLDAR